MWNLLILWTSSPQQEHLRFFLLKVNLRKWLKISSKWPNCLFLYHQKCWWASFFILNQSEAKLSLDRTWSYNLLKQNLPKSATFSDISPIDGGFELFEYAKLPTGFYQSREMTGKAPSCRETTQQAFFKGESLSTSHWNIKEMRPLLTTETSSGTLMWCWNTCRAFQCETKLWLSLVVSGSFRWADFQKKIADDRNTARFDGLSMFMIVYLIMYHGFYTSQMVSQRPWNGGMEFVDLVNSFIYINISPKRKRKSSPSQNSSGMDTTEWYALHLPPPRLHVMPRKKKPPKGWVGFLLSLFQRQRLQV